MGAGGASVAYQQLEGGVPVFAGELRVQVGVSGKVRSATGELSTGPAVDTDPDLSVASATSRPSGLVAAQEGVDETTLAAGDARTSGLRPQPWWTSLRATVGCVAHLSHERCDPGEQGGVRRRPFG